MVDIGKTVEDFFNVTLRFAYSYVGSVFLLLRSPIRGALRLSARHRYRRNGQHVGPYTTLVLTIALLFSVLQRAPEALILLTFVLKPDFSPGILALAAGVVVTVAVLEAALRLITALGARHDPVRRARALRFLLYAASGQAAYVLAGAVLMLVFL
jgi:hypothetical protein